MKWCNFTVVQFLLIANRICLLAGLSIKFDKKSSSLTVWLIALIQENVFNINILIYQKLCLKAFTEAGGTRILNWGGGKTSVWNGGNRWQARKGLQGFQFQAKNNWGVGQIPPPPPPPPPRPHSLTYKLRIKRNVTLLEQHINIVC